MIRQKAVAVIMIWATLIAVQSPGHAQIGQLEQPMKVCVAKPRPGPSYSGDVVLQVLASRAEELEARGFRRRDCSGAHLPNPKAIAHVCEIAALKDPQLEADFEARNGVAPSKICELSKP